MGLVHADILLVNPFDAVSAESGILPQEDVRKIEVRALVDSGAMPLTINEEIALQLDLKVRDQVDVALADGTHHKCDLVGHVDIRFKNRSTSCRALVLPGADEVLLGVIPMEGMDVMIDPVTQQLVLPPGRPYLAQMKLKGHSVTMSPET